MDNNFIEYKSSACLNKVEEILSSRPNVMIYEDIRALEINLIYKPFSRSYRISPELYQKLLQVLDQFPTSITAGLFDERSLNSSTGFNILVNGLNLLESDNCFNVIRYLIPRMKSMINMFPFSLKVFSKKNELIIPGIIMDAKDREFLIKSINSDPSLIEYCNMYELNKFELIYSYLNTVKDTNTVEKCFKIIIPNNEASCNSEDINQYKFNDISTILNEGKIQKLTCYLKQEIIKSDVYLGFNQSSIQVYEEIYNNKLKAIKNHPEILFIANLIDKILESDFYNEVNFKKYMAAIITKSEYFDGESIDYFVLLAKYYYLNWCQTISKIEFTEQKFNYFVDEMRAFKPKPHKIDILWASKVKNPDTYRNYFIDFMFNKIEYYINETGSFELYDNHITKLLYYHLCDRYMVNIEKIEGKAQEKKWYVFVDESIDHEVGELYKWKKLSSEANIQQFIDNTFSKLLSEFQKSRRNLFESRPKSDKDYKKTQKMLNTNSTRNSIVNFLPNYLVRESFCLKLDTEPMILGVANGVLELANGKDRKSPKLIRGYHNYAITKYTPLNYLCDSLTKYVQQVSYLWKYNFYEPDVAEWVGLWLGQQMDGRVKTPLMLMFIADGKRGKSTFIEFTNLVIGKYGKKVNSSLVCGQYHPDKPDTVFMSTKGDRLSLIEETSFTDAVNDNKLKRNFSQGEVQQRTLYSLDESFTPINGIWLASNHPLRVETTDYGSWRRLASYASKYTYIRGADPNNILQREVNIKILDEYIRDPLWQEAWALILINYHTILMNEYAGSFQNVPMSKTIQKETIAYRLSQDEIFKYIVNNIVCDIEYDNLIKEKGMNVSEIVELLYEQNIENNKLCGELKYPIIKLGDLVEDFRNKLFKSSVSDNVKNKYRDQTLLIKEFCESDLIKFMKTLDPNSQNTNILIGIRILNSGHDNKPKNSHDIETEIPIKRLINPSYNYQESQFIGNKSSIDVFNPAPTITGTYYKDFSEYYREINVTFKQLV